jgi:hypothetical protein
MSTQPPFGFEPAFCIRGANVVDGVKREVALMLPEDGKRYFSIKTWWQEDDEPTLTRAFMTPEAWALLMHVVGTFEDDHEKWRLTGTTEAEAA